MVRRGGGVSKLPRCGNRAIPYGKGGVALFNPGAAAQRGAEAARADPIAGKIDVGVGKEVFCA